MEGSLEILTQRKTPGKTHLFPFSFASVCCKFSPCTRTEWWRRRRRGHCPPRPLWSLEVPSCSSCCLFWTKIQGNENPFNRKGMVSTCLRAILYSMVPLAVPWPRMEKACTRMAYLTDVFSSLTANRTTASVLESRNWARTNRFKASKSYVLHGTNARNYSLK